MAREQNKLPTEVEKSLGEKEDVEKQSPSEVHYLRSTYLMEWDSVVDLPPL